MQLVSLPMVRAREFVELGEPSRSRRVRPRLGEGVESRLERSIRTYNPYEREIQEEEKHARQAIQMLDWYKRRAQNLA